MTPVHRRVTEAIKSHACPLPRQTGAEHRRLALCWSVGLLVIFAPLAVRLYGNKVH